MSVTLKDEEVELLKAALNASDDLVTAVINGSSGQQTLALNVARGLAELHRKKVLHTSK